MPRLHVGPKYEELHIWQPGIEQVPVFERVSRDASTDMLPRHLFLGPVYAPFLPDEIQ